MKRQKCYKYIKEERDNGFTLVEIMVAILILTVGLLGMASLTVAIIKGNKLSADLTTATVLAQDKMEDLRRLGYSGIPATDDTNTEAYGTIADTSGTILPEYAAYKRVTVTTVDSPAVGMKTITVTAYWKDPDQTDHLPGVELKTIFAP